MINRNQLKVVSTTYRIDMPKYSYRLRDTGIWVYVDRYNVYQGCSNFNIEAVREILCVDGFLHVSESRHIKSFSSVEEAIEAINKVEGY
tara:strand:+ start:103 stop:369 length:267 start_codon:yes stop_codon:yes gene_type:complete